MTKKTIKIGLCALALLTGSSLYAKDNLYNIPLSVDNGLNGPIQVNWSLPDGNTQILSCNNERKGTLIVPADGSVTLSCTSTTTNTDGKHILNTEFKYGDNTFSTNFDIGGTYSKFRSEKNIVLDKHSCYEVGEIGERIQCFA